MAAMIIIQTFIIVVNQQQQPEVADSASAQQPQPQQPDSVPVGGRGGYWVSCPDCDWRTNYPTRSKALQGLGGHSRFCPKNRGEGHLSPFAKPFR